MGPTIVLKILLLILLVLYRASNLNQAILAQDLNTRDDDQEVLILSISMNYDIYCLDDGVGFQATLVCDHLRCIIPKDVSAF